MYSIDIAPGAPINQWTSTFGGMVETNDHVAFDDPRDLGPGPRLMTSLNTPFMGIKGAPIQKYGVERDGIEGRKPLSMSYGVQEPGSYYSTTKRTNMNKDFDPPAPATLEKSLFQVDPIPVHVVKTPGTLATI